MPLVDNKRPESDRRKKTCGPSVIPRLRYSISTSGEQLWKDVTDGRPRVTNGWRFAGGKATELNVFEKSHSFNVTLPDNNMSRKSDSHHKTIPTISDSGC